MKRSTALKLIPLSLAGYLFAWCLSYYWMMHSRGDEPELRECCEYFVLAWTFDGGELPEFIWLASLVVFAVMVGVAWLGWFLYAPRTRRRMADDGRPTR